MTIVKILSCIDDYSISYQHRLPRFLWLLWNSFLRFISRNLCAIHTPLKHFTLTKVQSVKALLTRQHWFPIPKLLVRRPWKNVGQCMCTVYLPAFAGIKLYNLVMKQLDIRNLPKVFYAQTIWLSIIRLWGWHITQQSSKSLTAAASCDVAWRFVVSGFTEDLFNASYLANSSSDKP